MFEPLSSWKDAQEGSEADVNTILANEDDAAGSRIQLEGTLLAGSFGTRRAQMINERSIGRFRAPRFVRCAEFYCR